MKAPKVATCLLFVMLALTIIEFVPIHANAQAKSSWVDFHLAEVWIGLSSDPADTIGTLPIENETFYVKADAYCVAGWSSTIIGNSEPCPVDYAGHPPVTANLDNSTILEGVCCEIAGITSLGPFMASAGVHVLRVELNLDRTYQEPNYADDVKVLTFTVPKYMGTPHDLNSLPSWNTPLWSYQTNPNATHCQTILGTNLGYTSNPNYITVAASSDGKLVAAGTNDGKLTVLDGKGKILWTYDVANRLWPYPCFNSGIHSISVSANGRYVAVVSSWRGGERESMLLFQSNGTVLFEKDWNGNYATGDAHVGVTDSGDVVIAAQDIWGYDKAGNLKWDSHPYPRIELTSVRDMLGQGTVQGQSGELWSAQVAVPPDGSRVAVVTMGAPDDRMLGRYGVYVLDGRTGESIWNYTEPNIDFHYFSSVAVSPDGAVLASNGRGTTYLFDNTGSLRSTSAVLNCRDIYGIYSDFLPTATETSLSYEVWNGNYASSYPTFPVAVRGPLLAFGINYQYAGLWNFTWNATPGVWPQQETVPYGAYFFDENRTLVGRIRTSDIVTSIALTDSMIILSTVGRIMAFSMSELAQDEISRATKEIAEARQIFGLNIQGAQAALDSAKSSTFWFDGYLSATKYMELTEDSERPIITGLLQNATSALKTEQAATNQTDSERNLINAANLELGKAKYYLDIGNKSAFYLHIQNVTSLLETVRQQRVMSVEMLAQRKQAMQAEVGLIVVGIVGGIVASLLVFRRLRKPRHS